MFNMYQDDPPALLHYSVQNFRTSPDLLFTASTSGSRGIPPWPPDLEAPVIQFGGPVYNLRAKQWILGPFFHISSKKISSLASLGINFTCHIHQVSHCASFHISSSYVHTSTLSWLKAITFLVCKDWSKVLLHKNVWEFWITFFKS